MESDVDYVIPCNFGVAVFFKIEPQGTQRTQGEAFTSLNPASSG